MPNLRISLFFFTAAIAGTLLHECGHTLAAICFGFHPVVHYAYCTTISPADWQAIENGTKAYAQYPHKVWIGTGGPLQTILTGFIGIVGLLVIRRRVVIDAWKPKHLLWIVLAYFHSRWVMNSAGILYSFYMGGRQSKSDEVRLLKHWGIDIATGTWVMLLIGCAMLAYTTFVLVRKHRWQLIVFGGLGSIAGGFFWLKWAGPVLMP